MLTDNKPYLPKDLTVRQTAELLQISIHSVYELLKNGNLDSYKVSQRGTRISQAQLDRFRNTGGAL